MSTMLKLQHKYLLGLGTWLNKLTLSGQESRNRTKFVEQLSEQLKENEEMRLELVKKYAVLDEAGEPKIVEEEGRKHYEIDDAKMSDFQKEYTDYLNQEAVFEGEGLKTRLQMVKGIVLNPPVAIEGEIAGDYDKWCESFEAMVE